MREVNAILGFTDGDVWRPGIGDPTVMGWITVAAYFFAALLCWRQMIGERGGSRETRIFWGVLTFLFVFLGINKQLDLQTWFTLTGRRIAIAQGWYENRRVVQMLFVLLIAGAGVFSAVIMQRRVWRHPELRLSTIGLLMVMAFVVIRAASFHHVDQVINFRLGGVRMNWVFELGAIAVVAAGAWKKGRRESTPENAEGWVPTR